MPVGAIAGHLERVLGEEGIGAQSEALRLIAHAARGSMRDALSLLDQAIAYSGGSVSEEAVRSMLGTVDTGHLLDALEAVAAGDATRALGVADAMEARSLSFDNALGEMGRILHRVALAQAAPDALPEDSPDRERVLALARAIDPEDAQLYYQIALHGRRDLPLAPDEYAGFSMSLMRMLAFAPGGETGARARAATGGQPAAAAPHSPGRAVGFDGDWPALARTLRIVGAAKQLAERSELVAWNGARFDLTVPSEARALADKSYVERLKAALREHLGRPVDITVAVGAVAGRTAVALAEGERRARQDEAQAQLGADPFVQELVASFDATIESIQPVGKALRS
jgi:DNA polymerase-3 subunit gamma/tau